MLWNYFGPILDHLGNSFCVTFPAGNESVSSISWSIGKVNFVQEQLYNDSSLARATLCQWNQERTSFLIREKIRISAIFVDKASLRGVDFIFKTISVLFRWFHLSSNKEQFSSHLLFQISKAFKQSKSFKTKC